VSAFSGRPPGAGDTQQISPMLHCRIDGRILSIDTIVYCTVASYNLEYCNASWMVVCVVGALCLRLVRLKKCFFLLLHPASNNGPKEFIGSTAIAGCLIGSSEEIGNRAVLDDDSFCGKGRLWWVGA